MLNKEDEAAITEFLDKCSSVKDSLDINRLGWTLSRMQQWMIEKCWPALKYQINKRKKSKSIKTFIAVDLSMFAHECFATSGGKRDCINMVLYKIKSLKNYEENAVVVVGIDSADKFRKDILPEYKADRNHAAELGVYIEEMKDGIWNAGIPMLEQDTFESDDILASVAFTTTLWGDKCLLETSDRDLWQSLSKRCHMTHRHKLFTADDLMAKHSITPKQAIDWMTLVGKNNVPGVLGVGEKTASKWLAKYGNLDAIYENIEETGRHKDTLLSFRSSGMERKCRKIHTLWSNLDIDYEVIANLI